MREREQSGTDEKHRSDHESATQKNDIWEQSSTEKKRLNHESPIEKMMWGYDLAIFCQFSKSNVSKTLYLLKVAGIFLSKYERGLSQDSGFTKAVQSFIKSNGIIVL